MEPILPHQVVAGGTYWSARGDTQWSAVRVLNVLRKKAEVERVVPRSGEVIHRKGKVKLDELVKRDPKLKGKDKPKAPPSEVFAGVREARESESVEEAPPPPTPLKAEIETEPLPVERLSALLDLIEDKTTTDDW